jgi:hypothetical protein
MTNVADFLTTPLFRFVVLPICSILIGILAKLLIEKGEFSWETFSVGLELIIAAFVGLPAAIAEKALNLNQQLAHLSPRQIADTTNQISVAGYVLVLILLVMLILCLYEMKYGRVGRKHSGIVRPLLQGVVVPTGLGAIGLMLFFVTAS